MWRTRTFIYACMPSPTCPPACLHVSLQQGLPLTARRDEADQEASLDMPGPASWTFVERVTWPAMHDPVAAW